MTPLEQLQQVLIALDRVYPTTPSGSEARLHLCRAITAIEVAVEALGEVAAADQDGPVK
jgi:hypothetical protein